MSGAHSNFKGLEVINIMTYLEDGHCSLSNNLARMQSGHLQLEEKLAVQWQF